MRKYTSLNTKIELFPRFTLFFNIIFFYRNIILPVALILLLSVWGCSQKTIAQKDEALVGKYSKVIGCQGTSKLKPAAKEYQVYAEKAKAAYKQLDPQKKLVSSAVYESLNKGIYFIHLAFQSSTDRNWDTINYLYDPERDKLLGFYKCY